MNDSTIVVTVHRNQLGMVEKRTHEWMGDSPYVRIDRGVLRELFESDSPDKVKIGQYQLLKVDDNPWEFSVLYVLDNPLGHLKVVAYKIVRWLDLIYRRAVITLAVWNLADFSHAAIPSWQDVRFLKWLVRK